MKTKLNGIPGVDEERNHVLWRRVISNFEHIHALEKSNEEIQEAISQLTDMVNKRNDVILDEWIESIKNFLFPKPCDPEEFDNFIKNKEPKPSLPADYEMTVFVVGDGDLKIGFYIDGKFYKIGYLDRYDEGLVMLSNDQLVENYKLWREKGCPYNERTVEFKGGVYGITKRIQTIYFSNSNEAIYNISDCMPLSHVADPNVLRHEHNNVPIIF